MGNAQGKLQAASGQALLELAIFGSMMLVVLGAMVSFGMNADRQQRTQIAAIRDGMWAGARSRYDKTAFNTPIAEQYVHIDDGFVPDPTNPFAIGTRVTSSYSFSNPSRHFKLNLTPDLDNASELPRMVVKINGEPIDCPSAVGAHDAALPEGRKLRGCTTAGFWNVSDIRGFIWEGDGDDRRFINNPKTISPLDKYDEIFGPASTRVIPHTQSCAGGGDCSAALQIVDNNQGEIVSRESAIQTCRQILNPGACIKECLRSKDYPSTEQAISKCTNICSKSIAVPNYCANNPDTYLSSAFEALFADIRDLGVQPESVTERTLATTDIRAEDERRVTNTMRVDRWLEAEFKVFYFRDKAGNPFAVMGARGAEPIVFFNREPGKPGHQTGATTIWETPK